MPLLLDPTIETDPFLMTFDEDGSVQPASNDKEEELRASVSIKLYHLNHFDLKERRRIDVCHVIREKVKDADMYYWHYAQDKGNVTAREGYHRVVRDLKKMISERAEYSAAARAILKMYRTPDRLWVDKLLTA